MKTVRIIVNKKTHEIQYEVNGVIGPACKEITDAITAALDGQVVHSEDKPDLYYELDQMSIDIHETE